MKSEILDFKARWKKQVIILFLLHTSGTRLMIRYPNTIDQFEKLFRFRSLKNLIPLIMTN